MKQNTIEIFFGAVESVWFMEVEARDFDAFFREGAENQARNNHLK